MPGHRCIIRVTRENRKFKNRFKTGVVAMVSSVPAGILENAKTGCVPAEDPNGKTKDGVL